MLGPSTARACSRATCILGPRTLKRLAELGITELVCDVRDEAQVRELIERAARDGGGLHILVSNAGIDLAGPLPEVSEAEWDACLDTNLKGAFFACKHAIPHLRGGRRGGRLHLQQRRLAAAGSRPGVLHQQGGADRAGPGLALCHAPDKIRFNSVCPGPVSGTAHHRADLAGRDRTATAAQRQFIEASPLARAWAG